MKAGRLLVRSIKIVAVVLVIIGALVPAVKVGYQKMITSGRDVATTYFSIDYVSLECKNFYSQATIDDLRAVVTAYVSSKTLLTFNHQELHKLLKNSCRLIKTLDCKIEVPRAVHLVLTGVTPYCLVNNQWILGNKKRLFPRDNFSMFSVATLPQITISGAPTDKIPVALYDFLHKIPVQKWQRFSIAYNDAHTIELRPYVTPIPCKLMVDEQSFFDDKKFEKVGAVFNDIVHRGLLTSKTLQASAPRLTFDLRFGERVVVRCKDPFKRGVGL